MSRFLLANELSIQSMVEKFSQDNRIPAISLSIYFPNGNKIVTISVGTLFKNSHDQVTSDSLFQVGSITKSFTAALILQLESDGRLNINDSLNQWFPQYPRWSHITIKQLLNHTSGIYDYIDSWFWWYRLACSPAKIWESEKLIDIAYAHRPLFSPGQGWYYSNTNYVLLGLLIEKIKNRKLESIIDEQFVKNSSYSLTNTFYAPFNYSPRMLKNFVHGSHHRRKNKTLLNGSWMQAAGALISTPENLVRWYRLLFNNKVPSSLGFKKMIQFVSVETGQVIDDYHKTGYGLGIFSMNTPYGVFWFTPGLTPGYISLVGWLPCSDIIVAYSFSSHRVLHAAFLNNLFSIIFNSKEFQKNIRQNQIKNNELMCRTVLPAKQFNFPRF